jgi:2-dehydropantoate 2-reductase
MRFLIVGAGAIGGYFGGRLTRKGEDVTFLVRPQKRRQLQETGLVVKSVHEDFQTPVKTITSGDKSDPFDVIVLTVKAYHLPQAIQDTAPYADENTIILPLLNGYDHFAKLQESFGKRNVLGGLCFIETTLDQEGTVIHTSSRHDIVFGEWEGGTSSRTEALLKHLDNAGFTAVLSENIQRDIWQKYIFIASMSGITTLMGAPVGPILAIPSARATYERLLHEIVSIARNAGAPVDEETEDRTMKIMESLSFDMKSSAQRDMEKGLPVEADHLHGSLLALAKPEEEFYPLLTAVYSRLKMYEKTRQM